MNIKHLKEEENILKCMPFLKDTIIAHKGVHGDTIIENTMPAFLLAMQKGYTIELDVHILQDDTIVVFHDDTLIRAAGIDSKIKDFTYPELKKIRDFSYQ